MRVHDGPIIRIFDLSGAMPAEAIELPPIPCCLFRRLVQSPNSRCRHGQVPRCGWLCQHRRSREWHGAVATYHRPVQHNHQPQPLKRDFVEVWLRLTLRSKRKDEIGSFRRRRGRTEDEPTVLIQGFQPKFGSMLCDWSCRRFGGLQGRQAGMHRRFPRSSPSGYEPVQLQRLSVR